MSLDHLPKVPVWCNYADMDSNHERDNEGKVGNENINLAYHLLIKPYMAFLIVGSPLFVDSSLFIRLLRS